MVKKVKLISICKPKQYKTLSKIDLIENGKFPVYGANGIIGKSDKFTHENPTLMVTCRGATCGTLNISEPNSYINGNAMAFDNINEEFDLKYLYYYLFTRGFNDVISGSAQPQITRENLKNLEVLKPLLEQQKQIAKTLDKANKLIELRKESITKLDALAKSIFIDMFGDPAINPKKFDVKLLDEVSLKITDGEHGTVERTDTGKMYLMARNISHFGTIDFSDVSYISEENHSRIYKRCNAEYNDLLLVCVGATIGKCTLVPKMESFSLARSVALIKPSLDKILSNYLLHFFRSEYIGREIKSASNSSAQAGLYLGAIKKIKIIVPPIELQNKFAKIIEKIEEQKSLYEKELELLQNNFDALLQKSFQE